ncbi:ABC transporter permease [Pseudogemmobacter sonorensis]|uniref:ABC transporter permease n=1 Tax=Pseudogemmobacter sonorensis TaxID=2989681 RepID=UPI00369D71E3
MANTRPMRLNRRGRLARRNWKLIASSVILTLLILAAVAAPLIAPHDPYLNQLGKRLLPPFWYPNGSFEHPLGTDHLGRDYLSRLIYGARVSLVIGLVTIMIAGVIGVALGTAAGFFGGWVDLFISYLLNVRLAMPIIIVSLGVVALLGNSFTTIIMVMGLLLWDQFLVVARSAAQGIARMDYVASARAAGASVPRILLRELLPNIMPMILVVGTVEIAMAIMLESGLSFLGLGVQPPTPSWGLMMAEGKQNIFFASWLIVLPGICLFVLVLAINLFGDGLRDHFSPGGRK